MADYKQKFYDITSLIQTEFDRNMDMYGDKIQCRKGCSQCCSQIFRITQLDGWMIGEHIRSLPPEHRAELQKKAKEYIEQVPLIKSKNWLDSGDLGGLENTDHLVASRHPSLSKEGSNILPCPALGTEGECTIYEARPVICRRFGMPIYDYKNPQSVHACELNFKDGDEITDDKLIPNQTEIGMKWDDLKDEFALHLPLTGGTTEAVRDTEGVGYTTIAEAIMNA